ncbi:DUF3179 domain-containing protein [Desulfosediminicola flagellatus]|uniref:DUF3179 domain-containing protein n=1 Tax=Desulfosediminicola flagellatus TaxID=2569541 RepID=UPI0010ABF708|nr:DUF3179 domain-containing protein [Desulfosediminicola flagellatus]
MFRIFFFVSLFAILSLSILSTQLPAQAEDPEGLVRAVLMNTPEGRKAALEKIEARGEQDLISSLILILRFRGNNPAILEVISKLAGEKIDNWYEAMIWQQDHPEIKPHSTYRPLKVFLYSQIDIQFLRFLGDDRAFPDNLNIRLEEITWGGVKVGGIPALEYSPTIAAEKADYLLDDDLIYGAVINDEARAYPLRILGWHEMANDILGGVPVSLTYCTLCGTGIMYEGQVDGQEKPFSFGSSGLLYRSNKLMFDHQTDSLWNQFTGRPVSGKLQKSGLQLTMQPLVVTSWAEWKKQHPDTTVLSEETGFKRDYNSGAAYKKYFDSPKLMFPVQVTEREGLQPKDRIFGIVQPGAMKAWPLNAFTSSPVINDQLGSLPLVLIGDPATQTVRAYKRESEQFTAGEADHQLKTPSGIWQIDEDFLTGPNGERLPRIAGRMSFWFAWNSFMGMESEVYTTGKL